MELLPWNVNRDRTVHPSNAWKFIKSRSEPSGTMTSLSAPQFLNAREPIDCIFGESVTEVRFTQSSKAASAIVLTGRPLYVSGSVSVVMLSGSTLSERAIS